MTDIIHPQKHVSQINICSTKSLDSQPNALLVNTMRDNQISILYSLLDV